MNSNFSIDSIGNALLHWTSYLCDVRRDAIINEGSIKYGISELLEVFKGTTESTSTKDGYSPYVVDYQFEYKHPYYLGRRVDLFAKIKSASEEKTLWFEFKHINKNSSYSNEYCRYIDDIIRLFSFHINKTNSRTKTYFMVFGQHESFIKCFMENKPQSYEDLFTSHSAEEVLKGRKNSNNNFSEILSIDDNQEHSIFLGRLPCPDSKFSLYVDYFENKYEKTSRAKKNLKKEQDENDYISRHTHVSKNHIIKTKLVYPQLNNEIRRDDTPIDVYIWEIYV